MAFGVRFSDHIYLQYFIKESLGIAGEDRADTPEEMIESWSEFIEGCTLGYNWIHPEFQNDLGVIRIPLDAIIASELLDQFEEHKIFKNIIEQIDGKFREITIEFKNIVSEPWWRRHYLRKAGPEYAASFNNTYPDNILQVETISIE